MTYNRHTLTKAAFATVASVTMSVAPVLADEAGQFEYMDSCASCHGVDARGSGPVSELMTIIVPPLTGLAEANGGEFPMQQVIEIIDGRTDVLAHGSGMPVWGSVYQDPMAAEISGNSPDMIARGRILSLAYYLESIQE